jgi:hypothetical protein
MSLRPLQRPQGQVSVGCDEAAKRPRYWEIASQLALAMTYHELGRFATCARNDMQDASLRELQSATGEELRPLFGRSLLPSVLDRAFKGE